MPPFGFINAPKKVVLSN